MTIDLNTPEVKARGAALDRVNAIINAFVRNYEWSDGESTDYTPSAKESQLIEDAINGLLADDEFIKAWAAWRALCEDDTIAVARQGGAAVPLHPTEEMLDAGRTAMFVDLKRKDGMQMARRGYLAMIDAAIKGPK